MRKQRKPPYTQKLFMTMPDGVERAVKLPSVEGVRVGARINLPYSYKGLNITIPLVRVEGGWDVAK